MPLAGIIINALEFLHLPQVAMTTIAVVISGIALIIVLMLVFYLGYLCSKFLKKMNKAVLGSVMTAILIYFCIKFLQKQMKVQQCLRRQHGKYIFSVQYHIFFTTVGVFF